MDKTLFVKRVNYDLMVAQIYVDDIVFGSTSHALVSKFTDVMQNEFEMSMSGELTYFLGLQVQQLKDGMFLSQTKYAKDLVSNFGMESAKPVTNPMSTTTKLHKDLTGKDVDQTLYRSMIGSLLFLPASRPDISFSVGVCYSDADWAGNIDDRKSTYGGCFYLGNNMVSWHNKKQNCVPLSTAKTEYIALGSCCT
ncbi:uncharacterized mitochondrial protein AtMg00810-like [Malus sylvestris]|uniref:uncharacterized mitochondrial protein AtMg00810-like n=1 Tax=Malus sylvestris TaxID=3752 RepID=UPI0021ABE7F0|nr:uncharacterized mitochondrial protein AtMg00810-like [Malus sylvestris]